MLLPVQMQTDRPSFNVVCATPIIPTFAIGWKGMGKKESKERVERKKERKEIKVYFFLLFVLQFCISFCFVLFFIISFFFVSDNG